MVVEWPPGVTRRSLGRSQVTLQIGGLTVEEALTPLAREQPLLTWVSGRFGIEVLPSDAGSDPDNFLNARFPEFTLTDGTFLDVSAMLDRFFQLPERLSTAYPRAPTPDQNTRTPEQTENIRRFRARPITLTLAHETVRELLSAVAAAHGDLLWVVMWRDDRRNYRSCQLGVTGFSTAENIGYTPVAARLP